MISLNHTIVPARDKEAAARFFAEIFGLDYQGPRTHFAPVRVNPGLTFDFEDNARFDEHHYAFHVSDAEFDAIGRIQARAIVYGSGPTSQDDMQISTARGRRFFFHDIDGHLLELLTQSAF